jgi:hypothetical protein
MEGGRVQGCNGVIEQRLLFGPCPDLTQRSTGCESVCVEPDNALVTDQNRTRVRLGLRAQHRGLDSDLGADAVRITDGQRDGIRCHNGSASNVSIRELSHTTVRSFNCTAPSVIS